MTHTATEIASGGCRAGARRAPGPADDEGDGVRGPARPAREHGRRWTRSWRCTRYASASPVATDVTDDRSVDQVCVHGSGNVNPGGILPYPAFLIGESGRLRFRGLPPTAPTRAPAASIPAERDQVEMGRPPVLDQRRAGVPPRPAVDLLDVGATARDSRRSRSPPPAPPRAASRTRCWAPSMPQKGQRSLAKTQAPPQRWQARRRRPSSMTSVNPGGPPQKGQMPSAHPPSIRCSRTGANSASSAGRSPHRGQQRDDVAGKPGRLFERRRSRPARGPAAGLRAEPCPRPKLRRSAGTRAPGSAARVTSASIAPPTSSSTSPSAAPRPRRRSAASRVPRGRGRPRGAA